MRDLGTISPKWKFFIKFLFSELRESSRKGGRKIERTKQKQDTNETNHSRYNRIDADLKLQRSWYHSQGLPRPKPDGVPGLRGKVDTACIPSPDTISDPQQVAKGNLFFYNRISLPRYTNHILG